MGKVKGLAHIGIKVKDIAASRKFYTEMLGFTLDHAFDNGGTGLAFLHSDTCILELIQSAEYKEPFGVPTVDHICLEVEKIDEVVADLKAKGVEIPGEVNYMPSFLGGVKNIFFKGPDGERIEFFDYLK